MRQEVMEPDKAVSEGLTLPFALIRELSRAALGPAPADVDADELLEAAFFSPTEEIRVWREDGTLHAARIADETGDNAIIRRYCIENPVFGSALEVKRYIGFDDDGQAFVMAARLCGWKGAAKDE